MSIAELRIVLICRSHIFDFEFCSCPSRQLPHLRCINFLSVSLTRQICAPSREVLVTICGMTEMPAPIALTVHISRTGECTVTKVTMPALLTCLASMKLRMLQEVARWRGG